MIDGAAGADLSQILMSPSSSTDLPEPVPYMPRPAPSTRELLVDSLLDRAALPWSSLRGLLQRSEDAQPLGEDLLHRAHALAELGRFAVQPASETPLNGELGPHRRFDWLTMPLDDVLELRGVLHCSVNDLVLASVCGALRRYLFRRRVDPARLAFRVAAPVSVRKAGDEPRQGNHVSTWILELPLAEKEPLDQLEAVRARTELKRSQAALGADTIMKLAEWLPAPLIERGVGLVSGQANTIVTNVPGPRFPLYSVGAPLLALYPMVPLLPGVGLGIALFSYDGRLCWGFNADYDLVPDLARFREDVCAAFGQLRAAAVTRFMETRTAAVEGNGAAAASESAEAGPLERATRPPVAIPA